MVGTTAKYMVDHHTYISHAGNHSKLLLCHILLLGHLHGEQYVATCLGKVEGASLGKVERRQIPAASHRCPRKVPHSMPWHLRISQQSQGNHEHLSLAAP